MMDWSAQNPSRFAGASDELAIWEVGSGRPVLLVHGFPDHPIGLEPLAKALAETGHWCIVPALPGYFPSSPLEHGDYTSDRVGQALIGLLDDLRIDRVAYIGHDWGAEIGFPLVAANPVRFVTMISLATPHPSGYAIRREAFDDLRSAWYALFLAYVSGAPAVARDERWLTALANSWSPSLRIPRWPDIVETLQRPGVMEAVCRYYRINLDGPPRELLVDVPAAIIYGGQDGCIRPAAHVDFSRYFKRGYVSRFLPSVGHWPHLEDPDATLSAITEALTNAASW